MRAKGFAAAELPLRFTWGHQQREPWDAGDCVLPLPVNSAGVLLLDRSQRRTVAIDFERAGRAAATRFGPLAAADRPRCDETERSFLASVSPPMWLF